MEKFARGKCRDFGMKGCLSFADGLPLIRSNELLSRSLISQVFDCFGISVTESNK